MNLEQFQYFCKATSKLHSIFIRVYEDSSLSKLEYFFGCNYVGNDISSIPFNMTVEDFKTNKSVAVIDESNFLIGYIKEESTNRAILIGPVRFGELTDKDVSAIMNKYNLPKILEKNISRFLLSTPVFSTENFLVLLSLFHLSVNGKLVTIQEIMQNSSDTLSYQESKENYIETVDIETPHTTGDYEENIIYYIKNGMVDEIKKLHFENYTGSIGKLGPNQLRSIKNALIILNSICLRAAISGGLDTETAYTLGERYAQRIENAQSITQLGSLSPMIRNDYCQRVKNLTVPKIENLHIQKAINYIQKNIYSKITIAELAEHVGVKPEYLSALCKQTLNCTMSQYISERKIDEAKKLLRFTDKSLSEIATLLCFSSQSHFQTHFKKVRGITPMEYRDKYNKK